MFKVRSRNWLIFLIFLIIPAIGFAQFGKSKGPGKVTSLSGKVTVVRDGQDKSVGGFGLNLKLGDKIKTGTNGKAQVSLTTGDEIYLAPSTEMVINEDTLEQRTSKIKGVLFSVLGKIRARITKSKNRRIRIRTSNAVIGVKGTDFVVEYANQETKVATVEGLVNMVSTKSKQEIDIPAGKMSAVDIAGGIMPLSEITGEIMDGVEIMGQVMTDEDILGKKVQ